MKVKELIQALSGFDHDLDVKIIYDGEPRLDLNVVYQSMSNEIMVSDFEETVYTADYFPIDHASVGGFYRYGFYYTPKNESE